MKYTLEIEIDKPRDEVVELFDNFDNLAYWQPGFISAEPLEGEPGTVGAKSKLLYEHRGREVEMIETVTAKNLPDEFSGTFEAKGMSMGVKNFFKEVGPDKTLYVTENEAKVSGILMRIIALIMPGCFKAQSFKYMKYFKAFVETGADCRETES